VENETKTAALSGVPLDELTELLSPLPRFRAEQIFKWIASGVSSFTEMENLPLSLRKDFSKRFVLRPNTELQKHPGSDGTVKLVLQFADRVKVEAVLLHDSDSRYTACISTQAGCPAGCVFCKTGAGFIRNLNSAEIVEQFLQLGKLANEAKPQANTSSPHPVENIVVMGMGEPLLNLTELRRALSVICHKKGMNFSRRRITISTCGISQGIADLAENGPALRLALSLTTGDEKLRRRLMPLTENQPLEKVKETLKFFQSRGGGRITLEAVLLGSINTRNEDAVGIAQFANGLNVVVNLIPWNPVKGQQFEGKPLREPSVTEVESFAQSLETLGLKVTRRFRRGRGVMGACGQLGEQINAPRQGALTK
jgi:23S rRNA (adenine2503-C2)-methyltransferase